MRYTYFEFENFKGIRSARLDLSAASDGARVFTLVGLNESGKTTVLEAINEFWRAVAAGDDEVAPTQITGWTAPEMTDFIPVSKQMNFNGNVRFRAGLNIDDGDFAGIARAVKRETGFVISEMDREPELTVSFKFSSSAFDSRVLAWNDTLSAKGMKGRGKILRSLTTVSQPEWLALSKATRAALPPIWYFPNFLFEFPDRIYLDLLPDRETDENRFFKALLQDILDALGHDLDIEQHIVKRARSSSGPDKRHLEQVLLEAERDVTNIVVAAWNRIFAGTSAFEKRVQIRHGLDEDDDLYVEFRLDDADGYFAVAERSLGFRWFFVYLLITAYRGHRSGTSNDMVFLFDEPASNLHQTAQQALLRSIRDLARRAVIIYTTHSHHLIEPEWLGTTFVVINRGVEPGQISPESVAKVTDINAVPYRQFAAEHPSQARYFQPILDVLDYAPSKLELVPSAVMTEGKTDFYLLSYFQRHVFNTPTADTLALMPGGGAGSLTEPIRLYLAWARPFVVLLDSDKAGNREAERYEQLFGLIVKDRLLSLADLSGKADARGIESLLEPNDKLRFARVASPTATEATKDLIARGVQEALLTGVTMQITQRTKGRVEKILTRLRERLDEVQARTAP